MYIIITHCAHRESPFRPGIPLCAPRYHQRLCLGCHQPLPQPHGQLRWYCLDHTMVRHFVLVQCRMGSLRRI